MSTQLTHAAYIQVSMADPVLRVHDIKARVKVSNSAGGNTKIFFDDHITIIWTAVRSLVGVW